jgi:hypothetical protein
MTTPEAIHLLAVGLLIDWQKTPAPFTTHRGKEKLVVSGIPSKTFWRRLRADPSVRLAMKAAGAWLKRHQRGQWEILIALNPVRADTLSAAWDVPITLPETLARDGNPF